MNEDEFLDDTWMKEFENIDNDYVELYNNDIFFVNLHFVYVNRENNIENIVENKYIMSRPNYITRDELIGLIKRNFIKNDIRYVLLSILKYNFHLLSNNINHYLKTDYMEDELNFLTLIKNIDTIKFEKTISLFQDLNDIYFIFYEKVNINTIDANKENRIKSDFYSSISNSHSFTKKVFLKTIDKSKHRKTQRK
jgi:hypothetical protein